MAKLVIKSDNITPFGGLYSIFNRFSASGLRETIDFHLGRRSSDTNGSCIKGLDITSRLKRFFSKAMGGHALSLKIKPPEYSAGTTAPGRNSTTSKTTSKMPPPRRLFIPILPCPVIF